MSLPGTGRVDILARDQNGALVVIEVKSGLAEDSALTQLLAYMSSLGEKEKTRVRGIILAEDFTRKLVQASKTQPDVKLVRINPEITVEKIGEVH